MTQGTLEDDWDLYHAVALPKMSEPMSKDEAREILWSCVADEMPGLDKDQEIIT